VSTTSQSVSLRVLVWDLRPDDLSGLDIFYITCYINIKLIDDREFGGEMKKLFKTVLISTLYLVFVLVVVITTSNHNKSSASYISLDDSIALNLVNELRVKNGKDMLAWNDLLAKAADDKARDIFASGYFDHTSPSGKKGWDFIISEGYPYKFAGENLAADFDNVEQAMDAWVKSPSHLKNILSDRYSDFGFAQRSGVLDGKETTVYVQLFGSKESMYDSVFGNLVGQMR
jgi:uncharacterized protein YkwD